MKDLHLKSSNIINSRLFVCLGFSNWWAVLTRVFFPPGQERAVWHTLEQKEQRVQRGQVCGLKSSRSGWRVAESAGSAVGALGTRRLPRRGRKERIRRTWMDMAGVKTFDLLVGVVLVLQCVRNVHAEITTSNGKKIQLQHRVRCACTELQGATVAPLCQSQVESGMRISCKCVFILHIKHNMLIWNRIMRYILF